MSNSKTASVYFLDKQRAFALRSEMDLTFSINSEKVAFADKHQLYSKVAEIIIEGDQKVDSILDMIWVKTQNEESMWCFEKDIKVFGRGLRSSDVGDVIVYDNKAYAVAGVGFIEIPKISFLENEKQTQRLPEPDPSI